jgi:hypothetical protein
MRRMRATTSCSASASADRRALTVRDDTIGIHALRRAARSGSSRRTTSSVLTSALRRARHHRRRAPAPGAERGRLTRAACGRSTIRSTSPARRGPAPPSGRGQRPALVRGLVWIVPVQRVVALVILTLHVLVGHERDPIVPSASPANSATQSTHADRELGGPRSRATAPATTPRRGRSTTPLGRSSEDRAEQRSEGRGQRRQPRALAALPGRPALEGTPWPGAGLPLIWASSRSRCCARSDSRWHQRSCTGLTARPR